MSILLCHFYIDLNNYFMIKIKREAYKPGLLLFSNFCLLYSKVNIIKKYIKDVYLIKLFIIKKETSKNKKTKP